MVEKAGAVGVQVTTVMPSAWTPMTEGAFDNPAVVKLLREQLPANAVAAFVIWLLVDSTGAGGADFTVLVKSPWRGAPKLCVVRH